MNLCLILYFVSSATAATYTHVTRCTGSTTVGETTPGNSAASVDSSSDAVFMIEDVNYQVKCCGVLSQWRIHINALSSIDLQVWRRTGTTYTLVGLNSVTPTGTGDFTYNVPTSERISVKHGDYLGWFSAGTEVIKFRSDPSYPIMNKKSAGQSSFPKDQVFTWAVEDVAGSNRKYAIGATVIPGDVPTFNIGTNYATTVLESTASGATIVTLSVVDDDPLDTHRVNLLSTKNGYFELDSTNLVIKTLQAEIPEGAYEMKLEVIDDCYLSSTSIVTLTVANTGIVINNLPTRVSVDEETTQGYELLPLDITEITDRWYCDMEDTTTVPFTVKQTNTNGPAYGLFLNDWPRLDYDNKPEYILKIHCYDGTHTASNTATVTIVKNEDPVFTNLDASVTIDAKTVVNSEIIFNVTLTDGDSNQFIYTMTTNPAGGPFDILDSGNVIMTSNVLRHHTSAAYDLSITVNDGHNSVGPRTLTVTINNINDKPEINNLPADINVIENRPLSTSLFNVSVDDTDVNDTLTFYATFDPAEAVKFFTIDNSGGVYTSAVHNIDFDILTDTTIQMHIMVTDGKEHDEKVLGIQIQNLNEEPSFSQTHYSITRNEGNSGLQFPLTRYNIRDPDQGDTHTFSMDCGTNTSRLAIGSTTGRISFKGEYDLDTAGTPTDFSCTVNVTDYDGLSDSCEIAVNIRYVNEHTPSFPYSEYDLIVYYYEIIGAIKTTIAATDLDLTDHGTFYYSLVQTYDNNAEIFGVLRNGSIYIKNDVTSYGNDGAVFDFILVATDTGGLSSSTTIHVTIPENPENVTTTPMPFVYIEKTTNTSLLSVSGVSFLICMTFVTFLIYKYFKCPKCRKPNCCKRKEKPKPVPFPKPIRLEGNGKQRGAVYEDIDPKLVKKNEPREVIEDINEWQAPPVKSQKDKTEETDNINPWISNVDRQQLQESWNQ